VRLGRRRDSGFGRRGIGDVAGNGRALDLGRDALGKLGIEVAYRDFRTRRGKFSRGGGAKA
jgi:hypothetical protein